MGCLENYGFAFRCAVNSNFYLTLIVRANVFRSCVIQTIVDDEFRLRWDDDIIYGDNVAFGEIGMGFAAGRLSKDRRHVLVRETNYHTDGSQVSLIRALLRWSLNYKSKLNNDNGVR